MRAILSVHDKTGIVDFAKGLAALGVELFSTGGTKRAIADAGVPVKSVSELTGFPEILDGRVKTLHPKVHGGILARRDVPAHLQQMAQHGIGAIDLVAVNLYPFVQTVRKPGVTLEEALENIDIGGPTMLRSAAKCFPYVLAVVDPTDYARVLDGLRAGEFSLDDRRRLAQKAFQHVALYDTAIASYLRDADDLLPEEMTLGLRKRMSMHYGENPHQKAALYELESVSAPAGGIVGAEQLMGPEISHNNVMDADAAWRAANDFKDTTVVIVKHANPCGLASHEDVAEAYKRAFQGDPVSAYGGIIATNRTVTLAMADAMSRKTATGALYHVIIAPDYEPAALERFSSRKQLRVLRVRGGSGLSGLDMRRVSGGFLAQEFDQYPDEEIELNVVTERAPTAEEIADLRFAWKCVKHVKSNAIVLAKDRQLVGMGAGQTNRVTSVHLAARQAGERSKGSALASDAYLPFGDNIELAAEAGVTAIIEPGGSLRDDECIAAANKAGIAMVFTAVRHFRH